MNDKRTLLSSFAWKFSERLLSQGIGLVIQILIARMIKPEAVGEMAILLSVINIFQCDCTKRIFFIYYSEKGID